ncbi:MAG: cation:proton antiporter [Actinomycetes bacterium]
MGSDVLTGLAAVVVLGVMVQWLAQRIRVPALVLLLAAGVLAGETGLVKPDEYLGDALFPLISLAVGVLLFDAGLGLRLRALEGGARAPVFRLISIGVLVTWVLAAGIAALVLDLDQDQALLLGAVVVVSGPTVVGPLLQVARPRDPARSVLLWEGVVVDPIGAALGLAVLHAGFLAEHEGRSLVVQLGLTFGVGVAVGAAAAALVVLLLRLLLVPDDLTTPVAVALAVAAFAVAEGIHGESGLFATTVMGVLLANQRYADIDRVREFSETTGVFVIGGLFILLAARVDMADVVEVLPETLVIAAVLVLLVRPAVALLATVRSPQLSWRDRLFVGMLAPRGVVAAATAASFSIELEQRDLAFPELVPTVYGLVMVLAVAYALSVPAARLLGVARPAPRGVAFVSDRPWVLDLADVLAAQGVPVLLVAPGRDDLAGRSDLAYRVYAGPLHELADSGTLDDLETLCVVVEDAEREQVALSVGVEVLGRSRTVVMTPSTRRMAKPAGARRAFGPAVTWHAVDLAVRGGARVRTVRAGDLPGDGGGPAPLVLAHVRGDGTVDMAPRRPGSATEGALVVLDPAAVEERQPQPGRVTDATLEPVADAVPRVEPEPSPKSHPDREA